MSRSYPIWNKVTACIYGSNKSFGAKEDSNMEVLVGAGSGNSHQLVSIRTRRIDTGDEILYKFYVDDIKVKEMAFEAKKGRAIGEPKRITMFDLVFDKHV